MTQTPEIIDLKRRLINTQKELAGATCAGQPNLGEYAYPVVSLQELPISDDNIFHKEEPVSIFVGIRTIDGNDMKVTSIPEEPVAIFYSDGSQEWKLTDPEGKVALRLPRPMGKTSFAVPAIMLYAKGSSFTVVD